MKRVGEPERASACVRENETKITRELGIEREVKGGGGLWRERPLYHCDTAGYLERERVSVCVIESEMEIARETETPPPSRK